MNEPMRLFDFPRFQQEHFPLEVMVSSKVGGEWKSYSTSEFIDAVNEASRGLLELGIKHGDKVALIAHNNRCEWNIMDHALLQIGAVDVPIYPTMTEGDYEYIFNHSESIYCFVSNDELYDKVSNVLDKCPTLKKYIHLKNTKGEITGPKLPNLVQILKDKVKWRISCLLSNQKIWPPLFIPQAPLDYPKV